MAETIQIGLGAQSQTAREFLVENVYPELRQAMGLFLKQINENGQLAKFWQIAQENNARLAREKRRAEKQRLRNEMGSDYDTTGSTDQESEDQELSDLLSSQDGEESKEIVSVKSKIEELIAQEDSQMEIGAPTFNPLLCLADILEKVHQEKHFDTSISDIVNNPS